MITNNTHSNTFRDEIKESDITDKNTLELINTLRALMEYYYNINLKRRASNKK